MKCVLVGYGSRGDVEPCVAVGRELARRGHHVRMAVPPNMVAFVESVGLVGVAYGPDSQQQLSETADFMRYAADPFGALPEIAQRTVGVWTDKSATLASLAAGADLLVAGMNEQHLAANVAEHHRIPLAALHFFPARLLPSGLISSIVTKEADATQRRALGLPEATDPSTQPAVPREVLEIQAYDELCLPGPAAGWVGASDRRPFIGALTCELPVDSDQEVLAWMADGTPPIYFGFGDTPVSSPADTVGMISAACMQLGERALICSGANDFSDFAHVGHLKVVSAVKHASIFPLCRAVVHHGGAGTTAAAMRAGVPVLILWLWLDQPMWADAIKRLRVGSARRFSDTTVESLVADLQSIFTPPYATRAREIAAHMTRADESVTCAADLVEDAARSE